MSRGTVIYLLQNLSFIINIKESIFHPYQKIEFLGMEIYSIKITLSLTPEKVQKVVMTCQNSSQKSFYNSSGIDQGYRSTIIHNTSSRTYKDLVKISSTTNRMSKGKKKELSVSNNIKDQEINNQINLVDREPEVLQWPNFVLIKPTNYYSNRCVLERIGSSLQRGSNIRAMVIGRENFTNKFAGTTSNKIGSIFLYQREKGESHTLSGRQQGSLVLLFENGGGGRGSKERTYDQIEQLDLALSSKSQ